MSNVLLSKPYFGRIVTVNFNEEYKEVTVGVALYREPTTIYEKKFVADTNTYSEFFNFAGYFGIIDYDTEEIDLIELLDEEIVVTLKEDDAGKHIVDKIDAHKKCYDCQEYFKNKFNIETSDVDEYFLLYHGKTEKDANMDVSNEKFNRFQPSYKVKCITEKKLVYDKFLEYMSTYDKDWFIKKDDFVYESVETIQLEKPYFAKIKDYVVNEADNQLTIFVSPYNHTDSLFEYTINIKNETGDEFNEFFYRIGMITDDCISPNYEMLNGLQVVCTFYNDENECQKVDFMDYIWECYLDPEEFQLFFNLKHSEMREYFLGDVYKIYTYDVDGFRI